MIPNSAPTAAGERAYQAAFQLLKTKQYNEAIEAFEAFNKKFPNNLNVANPDYFLGQLYLLQGQANQRLTFLNVLLAVLAKMHEFPMRCCNVV